MNYCLCLLVFWEMTGVSEQIGSVRTHSNISVQLNPRQMNTQNNKIDITSGLLGSLSVSIPIVQWNLFKSGHLGIHFAWAFHMLSVHKTLSLPLSQMISHLLSLGLSHAVHKTLSLPLSKTISDYAGIRATVTHDFLSCWHQWSVGKPAQRLLSQCTFQHYDRRLCTPGYEHLMIMKFRLPACVQVCARCNWGKCIWLRFDCQKFHCDKSTCTVLVSEIIHRPHAGCVLRWSTEHGSHLLQTSGPATALLAHE